MFSTGCEAGNVGMPRNLFLPISHAVRGWSEGGRTGIFAAFFASGKLFLPAFPVDFGDFLDLRNGEVLLSRQFRGFSA